MGQQRVRAHIRRGPNGERIEVENYKRTGFDAIRDKLTPVNRRRRSKRKGKRRGWLSPGRGWDRIKRAFDHARKRRKTTAAVLAVGGVAEIAGFLAARGVGALALGLALALTALAGGLLAASGGQSPPKKRNPPRGAAPRRSAKRRPRKRSGSVTRGTTRKRTVYPPPEPVGESFEQRHAETVFEGDDGKRYDVYGNEKGAA